MCTATVGATPVNLCTCAASSIFSCGVRGTPGWGNTLNRVPVLPNAQDGVSIRCARRAVFTAVWSGMSGHLHATGAPSQAGVAGSEVEVADVCRVVHVGGAEQDGVARSDRERPELASGEGLPRGTVDLLRGEIHRRVRGEETEIRRVPELEALHRAVGDVLLHRVRGAEAGEGDLAAVLGGVEDGRRGGDPDRGRGDDSLEVRVLLEQSLGHLG